MGYDLHITRAEEWAESESAPITLAEWKELVDADPEMKLTGFAETLLPDGQTLSLESAGLAEWNAPGRPRVWFDCRRGRISVKSPDDWVLEKMRQIAKRLGARVQGDEGESYDEDDLA
jgi:hypothetical protein